jgi:prepilin-type processing-associated H-X9-DG protein
MSSLYNEHKQLLFDYCIGLTTQEQSEKAKLLISSNEEASLLYSKMKAVFSPLESIAIEECPDDLVELTMLRINNLPGPNRKLEELLTAEQNKKVPIKIGFLRNFSEIAAIAAAIIIITGILLPTFGYARQKYYQQQCAASFSDIFKGYHSYISDNDGRGPSVQRAKGSNWLKESNTSHMYPLVVKDYVEPSKFICPCKRQNNWSAADKKRFKEYLSNYRNYTDFPDRTYCTYSFPVMCQKEAGGRLSCRRVIMADSNPIFAQLPGNSPSIVVELKQDQLQINSYNHNNRGQNILFGDGHVNFIRDRQIGHDDIYTLQDTDVYQGNETPSCSTDIFLAP